MRFSPCLGIGLVSQKSTANFVPQIRRHSIRLKQKNRQTVTPDTPTITGEELMAKAVEAAGGEANWRKMTSRVSTFEIDLENQGVRALGTSYSKAPAKSATQTTMTALGKKIAEGWEFFDGVGGEELYSFAPVDKYSGKGLEDVALAADFYGQINWKTSYRKIDVVRTAKVGADECYVVEIEPNKGSKFTEYYSTTTFLLRKRDGLILSSTSEQKVPYSITFEDYRDVDGIKISFKFTSYNIGNGNVVTTLKSVKHNVPVDDKLFAPRTLR